MEKNISFQIVERPGGIKQYNVSIICLNERLTSLYGFKKWWSRGGGGITGKFILAKKKLMK